MIPTIEVRLSNAAGDINVGTCRFNLKRGTISTLFTYDDAYLASPDAFAIDSALPLSSSRHHVDGLPGAMRDSAPDRWGRHLIARRELSAPGSATGVRTLDDVDYLLGVQDRTREGALRYVDPGTGEYLSAYGDVPPMLELKRVLAASNEIAKGDEGADQIKELLNAGSGSLGGARPKASVLDEGKIFLAKFPHPGDEWDVMAWEKTALDIASAAGVVVPSSRLVRLGTETVLIIERFDRADSRVAGARIPYLSAMSLLGSHDGDQRDYVELAEEMSAFVSQADKQLNELFYRAVISVALHNTDDHLRNIGFLRRGAEWTLSPVFDVNINPDISHGRATSIYGETGAREVSALRELAVTCGIAGAEASRIVRRVVDAASQLELAARKNSCAEREIGFMKSVIVERCRALQDEFL